MVLRWLGRLSLAVFFCSICVGPLFADLDVTLIERLPRYDYDALKNKPDPNDMVSFRGHVINWSGSLVSPGYLWKIDGETVEQGTVVDLAPEEERPLVLDWQWRDGDHTVSLVVDPNNAIAESSENNNAITDRVNAVITGFWVEQSVYDYFREHQYELGIGSNSWQDWIQRQMAKHNALVRKMPVRLLDTDDQCLAVHPYQP